MMSTDNFDTKNINKIVTFILTLLIHFYSTVPLVHGKSVKLKIKRKVHNNLQVHNIYRYDYEVVNLSISTYIVPRCSNCDLYTIQ